MQMGTHCLSDSTVEVSKQYSERMRTSRTLSLVLTRFWPGSRKLRVRCESGLMAFTAHLQYVKLFCGGIGSCCH